jgi:hypothetical protein
MLRSIKGEAQMNYIKKVGLIASAALAMSVLTGIASASASEFNAESFPAALTGSGNQTFTTAAGEITCPTSSQKGEATSKSTWWTMNVTDSGCTLGGVATTVNWGQCEIRYYTYSGYYIVCKGGIVKITSQECIIEVGQQELKSLTLTNSGSGTTRTIKALVSVTGMKFTQNSGCVGGAGTFTNGKIGGEILLKGLKEGVQQGIFVE